MEKQAAIYQRFDPTEPLEAAEEKLYVDWQRKLGLDDVRIRLAQTIGLSGSVPVCRLFTGHRGVGKTTELKRVKRVLEEGKTRAKLFACFLEIEDWMHPEDVTSTDLVFHMVRQIVDDLKRARFDFGMTKLAQFFQEIGAILNSEVELKGIKIPTTVAEFSLALKDNPIARGALRKLLAGHLPTIYQLINEEILKEARAWLAKPAHGGFDGILVIVDQLDRIPRRVLNQQGLTNHENLFPGHAGELKFLSCGALYTIPIELAYSQSRERLKAVYGAEILTLPVIPVSQRNGDVSRPGLEALCEIVKHRTEKAGASVEEFFADTELLERLCQVSGGYIRNLFILLRSALERCERLPVSKEAVRRTIRQQADDIRLPIRSKEWKALLEVHNTKKPYEDDPELWYELLRDRMVFTYSDDDGLWYGCNPLLAESRGGGV